MQMPALVILSAAIIPTLIYALIFYWADRYEREPTWLLMVAFIWGAGPAILVSLVGEVLLQGPLLAAPDVANLDLMGSALAAPLIEEVIKWLALLAIFYFKRQEFDGPLDGLIYGALVGFGFAMTENIFYFTGAYGDGGYAGLATLIFVRGLLFGMNHAFYTALSGIGLGLARNANQRATALLWAVAGLLAAISAHALHNLAATLTQLNLSAILISLMLAAANLGLIIIVVMLSWRQEQHAIRTQLADEVGSTLSAAEYASLPRSWRNPLHPDRAGNQTAQRAQLCVELALCKDRLQKRGPAREPGLPARIEALREALKG
jgi:RsiW-degrading membrane proteinase PrsW (M82 family)